MFPMICSGLQGPITSEVLMTQRDALESKLELIETKKEQLNAVVNIYRNLGAVGSKNKIKTQQS